MLFWPVYACIPTSEVMKKSKEVMLTAKAWNGRVICQWLARTMALATANMDVYLDEGRFTLACHAVILIRNCW